MTIEKENMSKVLSFRTSEKLSEKLEALRIESGLTRTEYINYILFGNEAKKLNMRRGIRYDLIELRKIVGELGSIGSNVNQVARKANTFGFDKNMLGPIEECNASIRKLADSVLVVLSNKKNNDL